MHYGSMGSYPVDKSLNCILCRQEELETTKNAQTRLKIIAACVNAAATKARQGLDVGVRGEHEKTGQGLLQKA